LESIKPPLENRIWYSYLGQQGYTCSAGITLRKPIYVARVVDNPNDPNTPLSQVYQYSYNSLGRITQVTDPIYRQTSFDYYDNGIDLKAVRQTTSGINQTLAQFGPYNTSQYGAPHRPSAFTNASLQTYNLQWNAYGQLSRVTNPKNEVTWLGYDSTTHDLLTLNQNWSGGTKTTTLGYDSYHRVHTVTDSEGYQLTYNYDLLDRLTRVTYPDTTFEQYYYNRLDLSRVTDRSGHAMMATYDGIGRPLSVRDRSGNFTYYGWCGCGGLDSITDPLGHVTHWDLDLEGRATAKYLDYPNNPAAFQYAYDSQSGRLKSITDAKGQIKNYTYNLDDTLAGITYSGTVYNDINNNPIVTSPVSFGYDPNYMRLATMNDGVGQTIFNYNPITGTQTTGAGQLSSVTGPSPSSQSIFYGYDELGRRTGRSISSGFSPKFLDGVDHDALGRVTSHDTPMGTFTPGYLDATYRLTALAYPNGQTTTFGYFDNLGDQLLKEIWNKTPANATLSKFDYTYDAIRRIQQWIQQSDANTPKTLTMYYDLNDQLTTETVTPQGQAASLAYAYAYDPAGNRTGKQTDVTGASPSSTVTSFTYPNNLNELGAQTGSGNLPVRFLGTVDKPSTVTVNGQNAALTANPTGGGFPGNPNYYFAATVPMAAGNDPVQILAVNEANPADVTTRNYTLNVTGGQGRTYSYDADGNCTGYTSASGNVSYEWDAENRLHAVNAPTGRTEFTYDGFGRWLRMTPSSYFINGGGNSESFVWDGNQICAEIFLSYFGGHYTSTNVICFYNEGYEMSSPGSSSSAYFYTRDHLGSIREVTDSSGNIQARYDYDPYGQRTLLQGTDVSEFGYAGYFYHATTGLYLTRTRAYDPNLGRWLSRDLIGEAGGLNLYDYVANNPIMGRDPSGLDNIWDMKSGNNAPPAMTIFFNPNGGSTSVQYHGGGLGDPLFLLALTTGPVAWGLGGTEDVGGIGVMIYARNPFIWNSLAFVTACKVSSGELQKTMPMNEKAEQLANLAWDSIEHSVEFLKEVNDRMDAVRYNTTANVPLGFSGIYQNSVPTFDSLSFQNSIPSTK
jgi:RHS repeat-associated protein